MTRRHLPHSMFALLGAALLLAGCGGSDSSSVSVDMPDNEMSVADAAKVDAAVTAVWNADKENLPALYVGIWDPEKGVFKKAYGEASEGVPATLDDSLRIGSISKTYTANVILQLVDDGKLALDDTITDAAPDVAKKYPDVADRTIRQLLDMHSGISDYVNPPNGVVPTISSDPHKVWSADELIATGIKIGVEPAGVPGGYSTTNYILLQEIAEEVTGSTIADLIKSDVSDPLGLEHTFMPPNDDTTLPDPAAHGYATPSCKAEFVKSGGDVAVGTDLTDWSASYGQGGGGMTSTLDELGTWAASGTGDALLPDDLVTERNTFQKLGDGLDYGLGVLKFNRWVGHEGEALGWESVALKDSQSGTVVALGATSCGVILSFVKIVAALYPDSPLLG